MLIRQLIDSGVIRPGDYPTWFPDSMQYLTVCGSVAYGLDTEFSDYDVTGFCLPPKEILFPHLAGAIPGFDDDRFPTFEIWTRQLSSDNRQYDFTIYSIVRFFLLCARGNPNIIDMLYTPTECVIHSTKIGDLVRENRDLFLSKRCWQSFRGYAVSQLRKMKSIERTGNRVNTIKKFGYDTKAAYHVIRLLDEALQILESGTIDIRRNVQELIAIRNGEFSAADIDATFSQKEAILERTYANSNLPTEPRWKEIKALLQTCIGSLDE